LWSNMQGGKKRSWPNTRPAFPRGNKSSCGRPGACQSKAIFLIMAKACNQVWSLCLWAFLAVETIWEPYGIL